MHKETALYVWPLWIFFKPECIVFVNNIAQSPSYRSLFYDSSIASSKAILQRQQPSACCFKFRYLMFSLRSSCGCLRLLLHLLDPFSFPLITCFRRQFLARRIQYIHENCYDSTVFLVTLVKQTAGGKTLVLDFVAQKRLLWRLRHVPFFLISIN